MNAAQINSLKSATDRKSQISALKAIRESGIAIAVKLNATAIAIAAEVKRLLEVAASAVKSAFKTVSTEVKANLAYWQSRPVKALNSRAVGGAIALSIKLGF